MKSIEIIVPRKLIIGFYPHPELYGDFIVELQNGMITDVYYNEVRDFMTITSEDELIAYLKNQVIAPTKFHHRNGVFALRQLKVEDKQRLNSWETIESIQVTELLSTNDDLFDVLIPVPKEMIVTYYWIEVGVVKLIQTEDGIKMILDIYETSYLNDSYQRCLLSKLDIEICMHIIKEYITSKLLDS